MIKKQRPQTFWVSLVIFVYSFFLFCQGIWSFLSLGFPVYTIIVPDNYRWAYAMSDFTMVLDLVTPFLGLILMMVGYWILGKGEKSKYLLWASLIVIIYSLFLTRIAKRLREARMSRGKAHWILSPCMR